MSNSKRGLHLCVPGTAIPYSGLWELEFAPRARMNGADTDKRLLMAGAVTLQPFFLSIESSFRGLDGIGVYYLLFKIK